MRTILALGFALALTTSCASFVVHDDDSTALKAGKVIARIPIGIATFGISELAIEDADCLERGCQRPRLDPAAAAFLLSRPQTPPPVFQSAPRPAPQSCTVTHYGTMSQVNCY